MFHLDKPIEYYVESNGVKSQRVPLKVVDLPTVAAARAGVPLPRLHEPRRRARSRTAATWRRCGHERAAGGHADDEDARAGSIVFKDERRRRRSTVQADGALAGDVHASSSRLLPDRADGPERREGRRARRNTRSTCSPISRRPWRFTQARARHGRQSGRGSVHRGRRPTTISASRSSARLLGQRRRREDDQAVRRRQAAARGAARATRIYLEEMERQARRLRVVLREGDRQRRGARPADVDERHLLRAGPAVQEGLQAGAVAGAAAAAAVAAGSTRSASCREQQREIVAATFNMRARQGEDASRQVPRERRVPESGAGAAARAGRGAAREDERAGWCGSRTARSRRSRRCCRRPVRGHEGGRGRAARPESPRTRSRPSSARCRSSRRRSRSTRTQITAQQRRRRGRRRAQQMADELAELFELELDKLANQYEMRNAARAAERGPADRRAGREAEGARAAAAAGSRAAAPAARAGQPQRQRVARARRSARWPRRPKRRRGSSSSSRATDRSERARRRGASAAAMRRTDAAGGGQRIAGRRRGGRAGASEQLKQAQQQLARLQSGRGERDIQDALSRAKALAKEQKEIESDVESLRTRAPTAAAAAQQHRQRKDEMDGKVATWRSSCRSSRTTRAATSATRHANCRRPPTASAPTR